MSRLNPENDRERFQHIADVCAAAERSYENDNTPVDTELASYINQIEVTLRQIGREVLK